MMKDLYYILGTHNKATTAELDAAYTRLAEKLQPRESGQDQFLVGHFRDITEAYELLSDPKRRRTYDTALKNSQQRRLDRFKLSYLNIAATLTLIAFTSLFGYYVLRAVNGTAKPAKIVKAPIIATVVTPRHHKRKHAGQLAVKAPPGLTNKPVPQQVGAKTDTILTPVKPPVAAALATTVRPTTPAPTTIAAKPISTPTTPIPAPDKQVQEYIASIQSNVTGLVYLHQQPNYTSVVLSKIPNHAQVRVIEKGQSFCKISFNDQTGYVPNWSIPAR